MENKLLTFKELVAMNADKSNVIEIGSQYGNTNTNKSNCEVVFDKMLKEYESYIIFKTDKPGTLCPIPGYIYKCKNQDKKINLNLVGKSCDEVKNMIYKYNYQVHCDCCEENYMQYYLYSFIKSNNKKEQKVMEYYDNVMFFRAYRGKVTEYTLFKVDDKDPEEIYEELQSFFFEKRILNKYTL